MLQFKSLNDLATELNNNARKSLLVVGSFDDEQLAPDDSTNTINSNKLKQQVTVNKICKSNMSP